MRISDGLIHENVPLISCLSAHRHDWGVRPTSLCIDTDFQHYHFTWPESKEIQTTSRQLAHKRGCEFDTLDWHEISFGFQLFILFSILVVLVPVTEYFLFCLFPEMVISILDLCCEIRMLSKSYHYHRKLLFSWWMRHFICIDPQQFAENILNTAECHISRWDRSSEIKMLSKSYRYHRKLPYSYVIISSVVV